MLSLLLFSIIFLFLSWITTPVTPKEEWVYPTHPVTAHQIEVLRAAMQLTLVTS